MQELFPMTSTEAKANVVQLLVELEQDVVRARVLARASSRSVTCLAAVETVNARVEALRHAMARWAAL